MHRITLDSIKKEKPYTATIINDICQKYNITSPRIGLIDDSSPSAFTYGSGKWNSRIVVSKGMFEFLDDHELGAVFAHEFGHVKHNDFIIMTIASTVLQLLYQIYRNLGKTKGSGKKKGIGPMIALIAYVFYIVGQYILLYLSRTREYYADKFSAEHTDANYLGSALVKMGVGMLASKENIDLVQSTQYMNIASVELSEQIGLVSYNAQQSHDSSLLDKAFVYDLKSPWAAWFEFNSTHPLVGKRIRALMKYTNSPLFDFSAIMNRVVVDSTKMWGNFFVDIVFYCMPYIAPLGFGLVVFYFFYDPLLFFPGLMVSGAIGLLIRNNYKYAYATHEKKTVAECLGDIYASPMRGTPVELEGTVIGRGIPGAIFSEDMILQDSTGIVYIDYQSPIPLVGNIIFSLTKIQKIINHPIITQGWFFRGNGLLFVPTIIRSDDRTISSYQRFYAFLMSFLLFLGSIVLYYNLLMR